MVTTDLESRKKYLQPVGSGKVYISKILIQEKKNNFFSGKT